MVSPGSGFQSSRKCDRAPVIRETTKPIRTMAASAPAKMSALMFGWPAARSRALAHRQQAQRVLEQLPQVLDEARRVPAVDDAVVAGQGQVHHLANVEHAVDDDRHLLDLVDGD